MAIDFDPLDGNIHKFGLVNHRPDDRAGKRHFRSTVTVSHQCLTLLDLAIGITAIHRAPTPMTTVPPTMRYNIVSPNAANIIFLFLQRLDYVGSFVVFADDDRFLSL